MEPKPYDGYGERLAVARLRAGAARGKLVTQDELARWVGVHQKTVAAWEQETKLPSLAVMTELAEMLGVPPEWLVFAIETKPHGTHLDADAANPANGAAGGRKGA